MKITKKSLKNSKVELTVVVEEKELIKYREKAIKKISESLDVQGFRKGHIPTDVVIKTVGEESISQETQYTAISASYKKALEENDLFPLDQPQIKVEKDSPLTFIITIEVKPEIDLGKYRDIKISVKEEKITKKEIDDVLKQLQEQFPEFNEVKRKCKKGDKVNIDFAGFTLKDEPVANTEAKGQELELGSKQFIPGFEEEIEGMKAGEEKTFEITFPKDYNAKEMAGNKYKFKIKLNNVKEKVLPEINEVFIEKLLGKKESVDFLKKDIEKNLEIKKYNDNRIKAEEELLDKLSSKIKIEVPEILTKDESDTMIDNIKMGGLQQGYPWEKYLEAMKKTEEDIRKEIKDEAEKRVKYRLIIQEIIQKEELSSDEKEVESRAKHSFSHLKPEQKDKIKKAYEKGGEKYEQIRNMILVGKVFNSFLGEPKK